ncbi:MAG TPA: sigma-70 family RNA polymerase sigma factor [Longimicrobiales bacterium]|nr:sigma-70 family RNA polymerase sigma factor [Longimicrobiales bacterium]
MDFEAFFDDVFPSLYRYCTRLTGDADVAEDVAQEAFLRFVRDEVEGPPGALRVWLFKVATHLVRDRYRVSENRRRLLEENPVTPSPLPDPDGDLARNERVAAVRRALDGMGPRDRQLLLMRGEGFSYREMADAVGVKATSIGTLLARAQARFVEAYEGRPVESGPGEDHERSD